MVEYGRQVQENHTVTMQIRPVILDHHNCCYQLSKQSLSIALTHKVLSKTVIRQCSQYILPVQGAAAHSSTDPQRWHEGYKLSVQCPLIILLTTNSTNPLKQTTFKHTKKLTNWFVTP